MNKLLQFKGTWRTYQERVLHHADDDLKDGRIHIVAAPGSGKTTLGIELIGRLNQPSLILAPSITIREQWINRMKEGFLVNGINPLDVISNNLKNPKFITVATYQALHSAMTRFCGKMIENAEEMEKDSDDVLSSPVAEDVDYSDFELITSMKEIGLGILCLDECHHLKSEWWKALESFRKVFENVKVISLTATPPYDSTPAMWKRYIDMCGEIDEEITIPELVKEGSLCPHQDYVLFNYPTRQETIEIEKFQQNSEHMFLTLMEDKTLETVIRSHRILNSEVSDESLLESPGYLSSLLIYFQEKQIPFPNRLKHLLGAKKLPHMEEKWMEYLLQGLLFDDCDSYVYDKVFKEELIKKLKGNGLLEKKKVCMTASSIVQKMLVQSKGKIESIKEIVTHEYQNMGTSLRLLILTDYIRKEYEAYLGDLEKNINQMGVLPFFEMLRREAEHIVNKQFKLRLGVLCGTIVIIPAEAKNLLLQIVGVDKVTFSKVGKLSEEDYVVVKAVGDAHFLTAAVTELFTNGVLQALIGTKSLLGEGWDAPCVNSLILASFVGSFMLSNQMRGRAIRVDSNNPNKVSNIWHLVCIHPSKLGKEFETAENSEDYQMLIRRTNHFLGLHYEDETIESGIGRLSAIQLPFTKSTVKQINEKMLLLSEQREQLKSRWQKAIIVMNKMEIVDEVSVPEQFITMTLFYDALRKMAMTGIITTLYLLLYTGVFFENLGLIGLLITVGLILGVVLWGIKTWIVRSPLMRLKAFGQGIQKAMTKSGMLPNEGYKVETQSSPLGYFHAVYLMGGTQKEKADFARNVSQFFEGIDNQRYLLVKHGRRKRLDGFFVVPEAFAKKKEDAQLFVECMKHSIGNYDLVYTRNSEGRQLLLEGRVRALANQEQRCIKKKKVKGTLE